jgi:hypothetical protein
MIKSKVVNSDLQMYIFMLEDEKQKVYDDMNELKIDLKKRFKIDVSINQLNYVVYENNVSDLTLDAQLIYSNVFSV